MNFNEIYKKIVALENNQPIEECGMGAMSSPMPQQDNVNMNVSMSGSGSGGIKDLLDILRNLDQPGGDVGHDHSSIDIGMPGELELDGPEGGDMKEPNGADELGQLLKLAGSEKEVLPGNDGLDEPGENPEEPSDDEKEADESFANQPDEVYGDVGSVTQDTAGGLNAPHQQFKKEYPGDNPMAEGLKSKLAAKYQSYR